MKQVPLSETRWSIIQVGTAAAYEDGPEPDSLASDVSDASSHLFSPRLETGRDVIRRTAVQIQHARENCDFIPFHPYFSLVLYIVCEECVSTCRRRKRRVVALLVEYDNRTGPPSTHRDCSDECEPTVTLHASNAKSSLLVCVFSSSTGLSLFFSWYKKKIEILAMWRTRVSFRSYWMTRQSVFSSPTWESSDLCRTGLALFCFLPGKTNNKKCAPKNNVGQNFIRYSRHQQRN